MHQIPVCACVYVILHIARYLPVIVTYDAQHTVTPGMCFVACKVYYINTPRKGLLPYIERTRYMIIP